MRLPGASGRTRLYQCIAGSIPRSFTVAARIGAMRFGGCGLGRQSLVDASGRCKSEEGPKKKRAGACAPALVLQVRLSDYAVRCASDLSPLIAACAAARRAMGTRNGEQDT